jgi:hypothetical protein
MDVYEQSYISLLDMLLVYINVMHSLLNGTGNTSIYEAKNSCYDTSYIFRLAQRRFVELNSSCTVIVFQFLYCLLQNKWREDKHAQPLGACHPVVRKE